MHIHIQTYTLCFWVSSIWKTRCALSSCSWKNLRPKRTFIGCLCHSTPPSTQVPDLVTPAIQATALPLSYLSCWQEPNMYELYYDLSITALSGLKWSHFSCLVGKDQFVIWSQEEKSTGLTKTGWRESRSQILYKRADPQGHEFNSHMLKNNISFLYKYILADNLRWEGKFILI